MSNTQRCPFCGSIDTHLSLDTQIKRGLGHVAEFGIGFAAGYLGLGELVEDSDINIADTVNKEWECNSCGRTWNPCTLSVQQRSYRGNQSYSQPKKQIPAPQKSQDLIEREKRYEREYINCLKDSKNKKISRDDREMLDSLRDRLRLTGTRVAEIEASALASFRANPMPQEQNPVTSTDKKGANQTSNPKYEGEYIEALKDCLSDSEISERERRLLDRLRVKCGISRERSIELEKQLKEPQLTDEEKEYLEAYREACEDGQLSDKERRMLNRLREMLGVTEERAKEIELF